ncbi:hypothetical protein Bp8pS_147 [Bacillus phage vB_BpuM-BpSp]|nr:hypothetical protein Bp8pS_147 [Bacillus phage vB_BpuM-BpSp]
MASLLIEETFLFNLVEGSKPEINLEKENQLKEKSRKVIKSVSKNETIIFRAVDIGNRIDIKIVGIDKNNNERTLETVSNVFKKDSNYNSSNIIEVSLRLGNEFKKVFDKCFNGNKSLIKLLDFYFTYHDDNRALNLNTSKWEKIN